MFYAQSRPRKLLKTCFTADFGGRASQIYGTLDRNDHGTHVAGTVGSTTFGVAKRTTLFGVKVLNEYGSGEFSEIIAGVDFVLGDAPSRNCPNGVFVNMSFGSDDSAILKAGVSSLVQADIFVAVAAGNRNYDAVDYSPANEPSACTVGATNSTDGRAAGTNWGSVIDIFAPGQSILSTSLDGGTVRY
jgi:subtilisin family serine protease